MILTPEQPTLALHARNAAESAHPELWRGLVGAWIPALGYQGSRLYDMSGNGNNGTLQGNPRWTMDQFGNALEFFGLNDFILAGDAPESVRGSNNRTVTAWIQSKDNTDDQTIMFYGDKGNGGVGEKFTLRLDAGKLRFEVNGGGNTTNLIVADGTWHHVAMVLDGTKVSDVTLYVDLLAEQLTNNQDVITSNANPIMIGSSVDIRNRFDGFIDNVRIYSRALTPSEIRTLYTDPMAGFRLRDDTALVTAAMFGGTTTPSVTLPPPLFNMQMTGSF